MNSCRAMRSLLAPRAILMAISRSRVVKRARRRLAMLTQAIINTNTTDPNSNKRESLRCGPTTHSRMGMSLADQSMRN